MRFSFPRYGLAAVLYIASIVSFQAFSAPYFGREHAFTQPDGSSVTVVLNGDEFYMRAETLDGFTVVRDPQTGYICYADLSADGSELISTGVPVETAAATASAQTFKEFKTLAAGRIVKRKLKIKDQAKLDKVKQKQEQLFGSDYEVINGLAYPVDGAQQTSAAVEDFDLYQPAEAAAGVLPPTKNISRFTGTIRGLVLIFDFSDAPASYTIQQYRDKVNKTNSHYSNGNASSLRTFYEDVSRGVFLMDHYVYGIYRAPQTFAYYDNLNYGDGAHQLMSLALNDMEANGFDFSQLTTFSSGEIRALVVMYTGNPKAWAEGMWYHAGGWSGFSADGVHTGRYCTDTANDLNPGTLIHEHGHMAAEWPDTYSYIGGEPGTWGVMGGGYCDLPNPYFLYENGWLDAENIMDVPGLKTMNSSDPHFAYCYYDPDQPTEFYMIRPYVRSLLYCPTIPDQGMTFWRINTQGDNAQFPDRDRHIELVHANNVDTNKTSNVCFKEGGLLDHFSTVTTPSSDWKYGVKALQPSGLEAFDISAAGAQMTFILGTPPEPVPYYPLNGSFNDLSGSGLNAVGYNFASQWSEDTFQDSYYDLDRSLRFDGADDYVVCPAAVSASNELTVAFWMKPDIKADKVLLDKFPTGSGGAGWSIRQLQNGGIAFVIGSQSNYTSATTPVPVYEAGRWTHVACTFDGGVARIFINGQLRMIKQGIAQTPNASAPEVYMGRGSVLYTTLFYQGLLDDVRIYNIALESKSLNAMDGLNRRPDKGMLAYLKLDETSGTAAGDASGHGSDGTLANGLSFSSDAVAGPLGAALDFDGTDDYIALAPVDSKRRGGFTVALWAYPTAVKSWSRFIDFGNGSSSDNILLARYQGSNDLTFEAYNGSASGGSVRAPGAIELNKWQFFAATVDAAGYAKVYKNGQFVQSGTTAVPKEVYRRNLYIGRSNWSSDSYYQGRMDDIRIYNYPLSDTEIAAIYQNNRTDGPVPFSGADNVSPETFLTFSPAPNAVRHDIYFGTEYGAVLSADTQSPEYVGRKTAAAYNPPLLDAWREYYWRVDEVLADGTIQTGPVWRFSTVGFIQRQVWLGLTGNSTANLTQSPDYPDNPSLVSSLDRFETPTNWDDNYGTRVHGLLVPRTTGSYRFWIASDDNSKLYLNSAGDDPAGAVQIAYINDHTSSREWTKYASQQSGLYTLTAGKAYYIMALQKEGVGGDNLAVAWQGPDCPTRDVIDSFWLRPPRENESPAFAPAAGPALNAVEGRTFSAALPVTAADPEGQPLTYRRQAGPGWLQVAANGQLSGTPQNADAGLNTFVIRALDGKGGFDDAVVAVNVADRFSGTMGWDDLVGFAGQWLSGDVDSAANLNQAAPVDVDDFAILSGNWNTGLVEGLVAYWPMDEAQGLIARDCYAGYDGTLTNMTEYNWTNGMLDNGLVFDGLNDYVRIAGYKGIAGGADRTCSAWIKIDGAGSNMVILNWGLSTAGRQWLMGVFASGEFVIYSGGPYIKTNAIVTDGKWHHVAAVLHDDGSPTLNEVKLYIDGALQAVTVSSAQAINTGLETDMFIGAVEVSGGSVGSVFKGTVDEVRVYNRVLNANEIAQQAAAGLQLRLSLDQTAGTVAADGSVYNRDAIFNAEPAWEPAGKIGGAVSLNGTGYAQVTAYKGITGAAPRTCSAWIKTSGSASNMTILSWGGTASGQQWLLGIFSTGELVAYAGGPYVKTVKTVTDGQWHHVAAVLVDEGSPTIDEVKLYVDGALQNVTFNSTAAVNTAAGQDVSVGAVQVVSGQFGSFFTGLLDEIRIYDKPLNEAQVDQLANP